MVADAAGALTFGGDHLDDLAPVRNQIGETSCHLIRQLPELRLGCLGEMGDYRRVDRIGLSSSAESHREGRHLCWIDDHHGKAGTSQARGHHCLEAASALNCTNAGDKVFEPGEEMRLKTKPSPSDEPPRLSVPSTLRCRLPSRPSDPILAQTGFDHGPSDCSGSMERQARTRTPLRALRSIDFSASRLPPRCHRSQTGETSSYKDFWPIVAIEGAQKPGPVKKPAEQVVREIRRSTRRHFFRRGEDSHRPFRSARRGQDRRAVPLRGDRREPVLSLVKEIFWRPARTAWPATPREPQLRRRSRICAGRPAR